MPDDHIALKHALEQAEKALSDAEQARDAWEPDSDNPDHTASFNDSLNELYELPGALSHLSYSTLLKEHDPIAYNEEFRTWIDGMREREKRTQFSDFDTLREAVEEAESERDDAMEALEEAEEAEEDLELPSDT